MTHYPNNTITRMDFFITAIEGFYDLYHKKIGKPWSSGRSIYFTAKNFWSFAKKSRLIKSGLKSPAHAAIRLTHKDWPLGDLGAIKPPRMAAGTWSGKRASQNYKPVVLKTIPWRCWKDASRSCHHTYMAGPWPGHQRHHERTAAEAEHGGTMRWRSPIQRWPYSL